MPKDGCGVLMAMGLLGWLAWSLPSNTLYKGKIGPNTVTYTEDAPSVRAPFQKNVMRINEGASQYVLCDLTHEHNLDWAATPDMPNDSLEEVLIRTPEGNYKYFADDKDEVSKEILSRMNARYHDLRLEISKRLRCKNLDICDGLDAKVIEELDRPAQ